MVPAIGTSRRYRRMLSLPLPMGAVMVVVFTTLCTVARMSSAVALDHDMSAQELLDLGRQYRHGVSADDQEMVPDPELARQYFAVASSKGSPDAAYELGLMAENGEGQERNFTQAVEHYKQAASMGNGMAHFELAIMYANGHGVAQDTHQSITHYHFAAMAKVTEAQLALAYRYRFGYGVAKRCVSAAEFYEAVAKTVLEETQSHGQTPHADLLRLSDPSMILQKENEGALHEFYLQAAENGNVDAMRAVASNHFFGAHGVQQDYDQALQYFRRAARMNDPTALATLGHMYALGVGVDQNNETAVELFKKGADSGSPAAMNGLGYMYMYGYGVTQDYEKAAQFFKKAADRGLPDAQFNLGVLLFNGQGVAQDQAKAVKLFQQAADQGQVPAMAQLGSLFLKGNVPAVPKDCEKALHYLRLVAEQASAVGIVDDAFESFKMGELAVALMTYTRAAEMGIEVAQENLAYMYEHNYGADEVLSADGIEDPAQVEHNRQHRVFHWYRRSSALGNVASTVKIGNMFYAGSHSPNGQPNLEQAYLFYRKAADLRSPEGYFNLAYMFEHGINVEQDMHLAKRYYDLALASHPDAWFPVKLAMIKFRLHQWYLSWSKWILSWVGSEPPHSRTPESSTEPKSSDAATSSSSTASSARLSADTAAGGSSSHSSTDGGFSSLRLFRFVLNMKTIDVILALTTAVLLVLISVRLRMM